MSESLPRRERVADYHYACPESKALIECLTDASLEAKAALVDVVDQFFINTATWSLDFWEEQVGLQDVGQDLPARRAAVTQRLLSSGNTTAEMIRELAETLTGYQASVVDNHDYSFSLEFLGESAGLMDIDTTELQKVVEQIKPAHLRFVLSGLRWSDVEGINLIWQWFEDHPTTWKEFESMVAVH